MRRLCIAFVVTVAAVAASLAAASQLVSTSAVSDLTFELNAKGEALLTYRQRGKLVRVLAWGAVNARHSTHPVPPAAASRTASR